MIVNISKLEKGNASELYMLHVSKVMLCTVKFLQNRR